MDAGISCRETERRMQRLRLSMSKVKAIFVSHEHTDHIRGIPVLADKYQLPVYITPGTLKHCPIHSDTHQIKSFHANQPVIIGNLHIIAFPKLHDAVEPHSFVVACSGVRVGVFTDIGAPCTHLAHHFKACHAAFLEANYDEELLEKGRYPHQLKNRIRGGKGHLSNKQALQFFLTHRSAFMSHLILSHLSQENNCPDLVDQLFSQHAGGVQISVATRFEETPVYLISGRKEIYESSDAIIVVKQPVQMSLFE